MTLYDQWFALTYEATAGRLGTPAPQNNKAPWGAVEPTSGGIAKALEAERAKERGDVG